MNQINNGKEERERKEYTFNANKNYNNNTNNFTIQRKNSDSARESNVNKIPMGYVDLIFSLNLSDKDLEKPSSEENASNEQNQDKKK